MTMTKAYLLRPHSHNSDTFGVSFMWHTSIFSALTLLVGQQEGIRPVKTEWWGAGVVICLERGADLHMAQLMPLPHCLSLQ